MVTPKIENNFIFYRYSMLQLHMWKCTACFCLLTGLNMVELASLNWTWLLTGLFLDVGTDCPWLDEWTDLHNIVGTIIINQQPCSYMIEHVIRERWNGKIEQQWNNKIETTTMNLVVVSSWVLHVLTYANNPCRFAKLYTICRNIIEQYCHFTNPVLSC